MKNMISKTNYRKKYFPRIDFKEEKTMKNPSKVIPIFYACDRNFVKFTMVSLASMMENAALDRFYEEGGQVLRFAEQNNAFYMFSVREQIYALLLLRLISVFD